MSLNNNYYHRLSQRINIVSVENKFYQSYKIIKSGLLFSVGQNSLKSKHILIIFFFDANFRQLFARDGESCDFTLHNFIRLMHLLTLQHHEGWPIPDVLPTFKVDGETLPDDLHANTLKGNIFLI